MSNFLKEFSEFLSELPYYISKEMKGQSLDICVNIQYVFRNRIFINEKTASNLGRRKGK